MPRCVPCCCCGIRCAVLYTLRTSALCWSTAANLTWEGKISYTQARARVQGGGPGSRVSSCGEDGPVEIKPAS